MAWWLDDVPVNHCWLGQKRKRWPLIRYQDAGMDVDVMGMGWDGMGDRRSNVRFSLIRFARCERLRSTSCRALLPEMGSCGCVIAKANCCGAL